MKILVLSPSIPAIDAKGYQVQAFHRLCHLSRSHDIKVICFGEGAIDENRKLALDNLGIFVHMIPWSRRVIALEALKILFNVRIPLQCAFFTSREFRLVVKEALNNFAPQVIYAVTFRALLNLPKISIPLILDLVDSMSLNFRRRAIHSSIWMRPLWRHEALRANHFERRSAAQSAASFVVSSLDKSEIDLSSINILPLGVDFDEGDKKIPAESPIVVLTGNMSYRPNIEAALWFATKCWPTIAAAVPDAQFIIAGNNPPVILKTLEDIPSITVTGHVLDMTAVIKRAQVAIAPMQSGSGMQFKILEAMALGVPVIATRLGLGDIQASPNEEIVIAETPEQFISETLNLLSSQDLRIKLGDASHKFIKKNHSWSLINSKFECIVQKAVGKNYHQMQK